MPNPTMSEDTKSSAAKARHGRVLIISNPDPGDSSSSEDENPNKSYHIQPSPHQIPQASSSTTMPSYRGARSGPPPLTMPLQYPQSSSNPTLSSPSSNSSAAIESTPPPSTPGQPAASDFPTDVYGEEEARGSRERVEYQQQPARLVQKIADTFPWKSRRGSSHRTEADHSLHSPTPSVTSPTAQREIVIMVTFDCHAYTTVNVTGARSAAFIWERIFTEMRISDEDQNGHFSIYRTQISDYANGDALSTDQLFKLVRDQGDREGTLKFLISHPHAKVHETPTSPVKSIPPPPVLPVVFGPLVPRPRPSPSSRQESISSEDPVREGGYESSISDVIDDNRNTLRPPHHQSPSVISLRTPYNNHNARQPSSSASLNASQSSSGDRSRGIGYDQPSQSSMQSLPPSRLVPPDDLPSPSIRRGSDEESREKVRRNNSSADIANSWSRPPDARCRAPQLREQSSSGNPDWVIVGREPEPPSVPKKSSSPSPATVTRNASQTKRSNPKSRSGGGRRVPQDFFKQPSFPKLKNTKSMESLAAKIPQRPLKASPSRIGLNTGSPPPVPTTSRTAPRPLPPTQGISTESSNGDMRLPLHSPPTHNAGSFGGYLSPTHEPYPRPHSASPGHQRQAGSLESIPSEAIRDNNTVRTGPPPHVRSGSIPRFGVDVLREDDYAPGVPSSLRPGPYGAPRPLPGSSDMPPHSPVNSIGSRPSTSGSTSHIPTYMTAQEDTIRPQDRDRLRQDIEALGITSGLNSSSLGISSMSDDSSTLISARGYDGVGTNDTDIIWALKPRDIDQGSKTSNPPQCLTIETKSSGSTTVTRPDHYITAVPSNFPPPPDYGPRLRPQRPRTPKDSHKSTTFEDSTWAPRPPPEDVYDRLQDFFPEHDLDKPVIEANSGGTSPTAVEPVYGAPSAFDKDRILMKGKKSIRYVAEDYKRRIDRTSQASASSFNNINRKRSTKVWGSRIEEVVTSQSRSNLSRTSPDSPSGGPRPIFKWVRGELIGKGTYGRVYLALNATTGEMIAVKQVEIPTTASDKSDQRQANFVQALKMESETLKDLDHPHIVQYLGFEETPSFLSIFLEYVPGGSIGSCLRDHGRFDEEVVKSFTGQILDGLDYLHSKNIIHRDLKSDNILVEKTGICKISDFGISKRTDDTNAPAYTAMQGTVFWMAPEVINTQKEKGYNSKIDIWSVGCVVLEMWAGKRPWSDEDFFTVMYKVIQMQQSPPVPSEVILSALATDFKDRCFAINPNERATAAELLRHPYLELPEGWMFMDFK
ncbi:hypothetical protein BJ138DRAFT_1151938 [Hygrophoropsis aurantiaca]|uniref:Uncharacterized protein n=1 Tax=Hygrophoropsis aurantiaca TaxID=72124 RepID=A0ACB8ACR2_9AGAM|nr:hypothetical protein BJ138DRAFT_1151938 [Hygrophoropsis aurantiaca]